MDNSANMLQLCRLCLVKDEVNIPIFEEQGDIRQIFLKISSCLPVKVSREDKLPKKICDGCSCKLDMLYEFWNTSANAEKQLLSWLGEAGMSAKMNDGHMSAVAQQIKPNETLVKEEELDPSDLQKEEDDDDEDDEEKSYMFQQKLEENNAGPSATATSNEEEEQEQPPPKRARRTAAVKAAIAMDHDSDDDDDSGEPLTKVEDESEDSDCEDAEPAFVDAPSTSADDQPGPSGVGKDGADAPMIRFGKSPYTYTSPKEEVPTTPSPLGTNFDVKLEEDCGTQILLKCEPDEEQIEYGESLWENECPKSPLSNDTEVVENLIHNSRFQIGEELSRAISNKVLDKLIHHSSATPYKCELCDSSFKSLTAMKSHIYVKHDERCRYLCSKCNRDFCCNISHDDHYKVVHENFRFICELCSKKFASRYSFDKHMEIHDPSSKKQFKCKDCDKICYSMRIFLKHRKMHLVLKEQVICDICGKNISSKYGLKIHMAVHIDEKPHTCEVCKITFKQRSSFILHMRSHTGGKPYSCQICSSSFVSKRSLNMHRCKGPL